MSAPFIDWANATVKITVPVHHTAMSDVQEIDVPLPYFEDGLLACPACLERWLAYRKVTGAMCPSCGHDTLGDDDVCKRPQCRCGHAGDGKLRGETS